MVLEAFSPRLRRNVGLMRASSTPSRWTGRQAFPRSIAGFSLVELMVVVTIISVIMAMTIPSYRRLQKKARAAAIINDFRVIY